MFIYDKRILRFLHNSALSDLIHQPYPSDALDKTQHEVCTPLYCQMINLI